MFWAESPGTELGPGCAGVNPIGDSPYDPMEHSMSDTVDAGDGVWLLGLVPGI